MEAPRALSLWQQLLDEEASDQGTGPELSLKKMQPRLLLTLCLPLFTEGASEWQSCSAPPATLLSAAH